MRCAAGVRACTCNARGVCVQLCAYARAVRAVCAYSCARMYVQCARCVRTVVCACACSARGVCVRLCVRARAVRAVRAYRCQCIRAVRAVVCTLSVACIYNEWPTTDALIPALCQFFPALPTVLTATSMTSHAYSTSCRRPEAKLH